MAIDKQAIVGQGLSGHRDAGRHDHPPRVGVLASGHPRRRGVPVRLRRRERHARAGRLRRHRRRRDPRGPDDRASRCRCSMPGVAGHDRGGGGRPADRRLPASRSGSRSTCKPGHRREDERLLGRGELRRLHLVLERRPRPELPAVRVHLGPVRRVERRLLEGPDVRRALRGAAQELRSSRAPEGRVRGAALRVRAGAGRRAGVPRLGPGLPERPVRRVGAGAGRRTATCCRATTTTR